MDRIWGFVLETSIYASILGIAILLVKFILKDKISGKWSYLLWMLLLVKLIMPFGPQSEISIFNKIDISKMNKIIVNENTEIVSNKYDVNSYIDENNNIPNEYIDKDSKDSLKESNIGSINSNENYTQSENIKYHLKFDVAPLIWTGGFIISLSLFTSMHIALNIQLKTKCNKNNKSNKKVNEILFKAKEKMKIKSNISVIINDTIRTPALCKIIKPKILFPQDMIDLSENEIEHIILHELAHHKRYDILINYLLIFLQCVHWFNPFIWYFFKKIKEDMELGADEMAVSVLEEDEHRNYGRTIITIIERVSVIPKNVGALGMADDKNLLKKRINMIKKAKIFKNKKILISTLSLVCILVLGGLFLTSKKEKDSIYIKSKFENLIRQNNPDYLGDVTNTLITLENNLDMLTYGNNLVSVSAENYKGSYKFSIDYALGKSEFSKEYVENELFINTSLIFSLIENIDYIEYNIVNHNSNESPLYTISFNRADIEKTLDIEGIYEYSENEEKFKVILKKVAKLRKGSASLDEAISNVIKDITYSAFYDGELVTEAHKIIGQEKEKGILKVYLISNRSSFGFENESFSVVSGEATPRYIEFLEVDGYYYMIDYKEVMDGALYEESIKSIFPMNLWSKVMNSYSYYEELHKEEIKQAKQYLKSINRDENATDISLETKAIDISEEAQNKLFEVEEIQSYPTTWIGTREEVISNVRYLYKSSIKEDTDGYKIVIFEKYKYPDKLLEEHHYKVYDDDIKEIKHNIVSK
ncbi:MAG: M56 family metallopeptidase [Peptostreptococcaceae bacterium]